MSGLTVRVGETGEGTATEGAPLRPGPAHQADAPTAGLPPQWPQWLFLPPGSQVQGHSSGESERGSFVEVSFSAAQSVFWLSSYFDALACASGFGDCKINVSAVGLECAARQPQATLLLDVGPDPTVAARFQFRHERNLVLTQQREYNYVFSDTLKAAYPPGFPSMLLTEMPGMQASRVWQRGNNEAQLELCGLCGAAAAQSFYSRHFQDSGFRELGRSSEHGQEQLTSYGRGAEVIRVQTQTLEGWMCVMLGYHSDGLTSASYDKGWR